MSVLVLSALPALVAAQPSAAVLLSRRTAVSAADANAVTLQVAQALETAQVPLLEGPEAARRLARVRQKDATLCGGKPACLKELLKALEVPWLVLVSVAQVAEDKSLAMELFDGTQGTVVEVESVVLSSWKAIGPDLLDAFARRVALRVSPPKPESTKPLQAEQPAEVKPKMPFEVPAAKPADAPVATALAPVEVQAAPVPPEPPKKSHAASWVLGGVGLAALATAGVLLGVGLSSWGSLSAGNRLPDGTVQSDLTGAEAQARASSASAQLAIAGGAAAVAVGLGVAAVLTW
jgi:hypothetical protein